ncbi:hypothetical protein DFH09DRAFT_76006 [Mycena vulgaris]|nr:hypothetical protein DFH09DRAFT_76006 [Mycena vulgaris]
MSSSSIPGYLAHLFQVCWSFFLSIFSTRHRKRLSSLSELPTSSPPKTSYSERDAVYDGLESWQRDKQQFLRRPSLVKADAAHGARTRQTRKKKSRTIASPPPEIYVQDWSSLGLNMSDLFDSPSTIGSLSGVVESSVLSPCHATGAELPTISEDSFSEAPVTNGGVSSRGLLAAQSRDVKMVLAADLPDRADAQDLSTEALSSIHPDQEAHESGAQETGVDAESATLSFSTGRYAFNALSAVSGLLWDPPSFPISHSTPLPNATPTPSIPRPQPTSHLGARDSMLPYPDLFDFNMYARRVSRDSFCDTVELPCSVSASSDKKSARDSCRPISIYDIVHERDRYRSAAFSTCLSSVCTSSPRRVPFTSNLNLGSGRDTVVDSSSTAILKKSATDEFVAWNGEMTRESIGAQFMTACDELSRCEWTEEEFLRMFAASTTV